ncbi:MAG TPA: hypothetical protein VF710_07025, partial [Longimicrobium sp.]
MNAHVTVTKKQGNTMGTVIARVSDPGVIVQDVNFYIEAPPGSGELGPYPPDIVRRPSPGVYEKDVILDADFNTLVRIEVITEPNGTLTFDGSDVQEFGVRTGTAGGTGQVRVKGTNTGPTAAETLAIEGATVIVDNRVATFNLDGHYTTQTGLTGILAGYYTKAQSDAQYPAIAHTHPYLPLAGGVMSERLQVEKNTVDPNFWTGHVELRTTNGSAVAVGFHRSMYSAVTLRHAVLGALDLVDHAGAWAQFRGGSFWAAGNRFYGGDGAYIDLTNGAAQFLTNGGAALQALVGGLLVSDAYSHATYVPANGIWAKGNIVSAGSVSAAGGKLTTGGASAGILVNARQANTHAWEIYNSGGILGWHSGQYSLDTMTLTQGGLLAVAALTARDQVTVQGTMRFANGAYLQANRADGSAEPVFWPRWTDNNTYLNYGSGGHFFIRDNASIPRMIFDPNGAGFTTWVQARGVSYDLRLGGARSGAHSQVTSTPSLYLDCTDGWQTYINFYSGRPTNIGGVEQSTYRLAVNGDAILHNNGWFRNANGEAGLYNEALNRHLYAGADGTGNGWQITGGTAATFLALRGTGQASAIKGWLYADAAGYGLLNSTRNWAVRTYTGGVQLYGDVLVPGQLVGQGNWGVVIGGSTAANRRVRVGEVHDDSGMFALDARNLRLTATAGNEVR